MVPQTSTMHICPECESKLVYPLTWSETDNDAWEIVLRCPDCEYIRQGVFEHELVEQFDHQLNLGTDVVINDLAEISNKNMKDWGDKFLTALVNDHILPEDFH